MSEKELQRKGAFEMVRRGAWSLAEAARHLEQSYRQCHRSYKRYVTEGDAGLVHKSRGRQSNRAKDSQLRQAVLQRYEQIYDGFGPTLAAEKLAEDGYEVDHETLRRWLLKDGQWKKQRRRSPYRKRRERREHFGELVQMDGSHHHWFGPDHPESCLINMIDDATNLKQSLMAKEETTEACMRALWSWIERYGIPKSLYTDKKNVFVTDRAPTIEEQLAGEEPKTAFGLACAKLGIEIIPANSPQAKGRVERTHGVDQDRLVKELKLKGVKTIEGANQLLSSGYQAKMNDKFAISVNDEKDYHRPIPKGVKLAHIFCFEEERTVSNDWVIRYQKKEFQISKDNRTLPKSGSKVTVQRLLDGTVRLLYKDKSLRYQELQVQRQRPASVTLPTSPKKAVLKVVTKPAPDHPWRNSGLHRSKTSVATTR
jgi:transposase-like protein